jgi:signal transduction histidine kinase
VGQATPLSNSPGDKRQALRPRARILRAFGDELISSEHVAITELVKNAYDADATVVLIRFIAKLAAEDKLLEGGGENQRPRMLEVIDNGHGMTAETVRTAWLEPATPNRRRITKSEALGRKVMGEKGIGRFATARLGDILDLVTRRMGTDAEVHAHFDWTQFDDPERFLDEIEVQWGENSPRDIAPGGTIDALDVWPGASSTRHGTILRITRLRSEWTEADIAALRRLLSRLKSHSDRMEGDDDFTVWVQTVGDPEPLAVGPPEVLSRPAYFIQGHVSSDGSYQLLLRIHDESENQLAGQFVLPRGETPQCGPFAIELRVWDRDAASMEDLGYQLKLTRAQVRDELDHASGVSVYRDGFRVLPYGEPHQDWLRLDLRRVQNPTKALSNNQIIGQVSISREGNPELLDQTNREGLMEGQALNDFRLLITMVISELEQRRFALRHPSRHSKKAGKGGLFAGFNLSDIRLTIAERHGDDADLLAAVDAKESDLESRVAAVQDVLARYRRLATLGQLIDSILHDGRLAISKIGGEVHVSLRAIEKLADGNRTLVTQVRSGLEQIQTHSKTLSTLFKRIEPFGGRQRGRPVAVTLESVIANAFAVLESELSEAGIRAPLPAGETTVTADPSEIQIVILNLLTNSIHWLKQRPKAKRAIEVRVSRKDNHVEILFSDSGPGVSDEFRDRIFEPYFSTRDNGVGLGLTIAGEIVTDYYGGNLELVESGPLSGATFRVTLRRRV